MRPKSTIAAGCCLAVAAASALPASAETVHLAGASTRTNSGATRAPAATPPRAYVPSSPSYGQRPQQAPSVDNNPIGDRGQSLYPPRATTDTGR